MKKIMVIGGTGFIGYHAVLELIKRGQQVTVLALPPVPAENLFPKEVKIILADLGKISDDEVRNILQGNDGVVFAAGADERILPKSPAYDFFYHSNVQPSVRLVKLAQESGLGAVILIGSYFAYFEHVWKDMELSYHHPYIRSRVEQEKQSFAAAEGKIRLVVLELPYIFGAMPGRKPLWKPLIRYVQSPYPLLFTRGGTNMIAIEHVAEAISGAVERENVQGKFVIGDVNLTWKNWLEKLSELAGKKKRVHTLPNGVIKFFMQGVYINHVLRGSESGLHPVRYIDFQTKESYFDPQSSQEALGYTRGGLELALEKTVLACR
jgi:dihydroflavonol-4-reductase